MHAIAFDMDTNCLKEEEMYPNAYQEIQKELTNMGFEWIQGSIYITKSDKNSLALIYKAITKLKQIEWFKKCVRDVRAFKIEDYSDFTDIVKN